jgi:thiamine-phosphate diphosphorylase
MIGLPRPAIFLVTAGAATREEDEGWLTALRTAAQAAAAGVDVVQIREPRLTDRALAALVRRALRETNASRTAVIVNDRADVAIACGAAGVHLRADGIAAARVRTLLSSGFLVGRSVHSVTEARAAATVGGVDYLFFGTVFPSASKPHGHQVQGTPGLRAVCESVSVPVIAIGGISVGNVREVRTAGAAGIAAIGLFAESSRTSPSGVSAAVRDVRDAFG